ncbi:F420-dependent oxidoreductase-like protein [Pseudonocardia endophytica]|uniref:F420-dependent oxidoreductase-like protein n=2 Tax=Pseudonocardia endophytica TaxID=401976 RepID=A0A4R1HX74_PSEEN|nr:F420-dependent oxidoreductase-like protein [Pseudonocardia endophytica]
MIGIGVNVAAELPDPVGNVVDELANRARAAEASGVDTVWLPQGYGFDTLTVIAALARETGRVELGASVVVVQPRHPRVLAAQALTAHAASHGRLALGLGVSHPGLLEVYGIPFERPVAALREHLDVLLPILDCRAVPGSSGTGSDAASTAVPGAGPRVPVLFGALGPVMLRLAGERGDGTITFLSGPRTIGEHVVPHLTRAADAAGRPRPRVVVGLPVAVTDDPRRVRHAVATSHAPYARLPSYAATLERDGFATPGDIVVAGDEDAVADGLRRYAEAGATDVNVSLVGTTAERERTLVHLGHLASASRR